METIIALLVVVGLVGLLLGRRRKAQPVDSGLNVSVTLPEKQPYRKKEYLLSKAERSFFGVLSLVVRDMDVHIFAKVRMSDLLYIEKGTDERQKSWNRIQSKHVDFVICDRTYIKPLAVIELDCSSHNGSERMERDRFVNQAYLDAGLPLLRFPVKHAYSAADIEVPIKDALSKQMHRVARQESAAGKQA